MRQYSKKGKLLKFEPFELTGRGGWKKRWIDITEVSAMTAIFLFWKLKILPLCLSLNWTPHNNNNNNNSDDVKICIYEMKLDRHTHILKKGH